MFTRPGKPPFSYGFPMVIPLFDPSLPGRVLLCESFHFFGESMGAGPSFYEELIEEVAWWRSATHRGTVAEIFGKATRKTRWFPPSDVNVGL
jgi:hypothetical protein